MEHAYKAHPSRVRETVRAEDNRRWRSSTVEQLICNQQVAGSIPSASLDVRSLTAQTFSREFLDASPCGGIPEWPKGADCKSAGVSLRRFESSSLHQRLPRWRNPNDAGVAQLVEHQPSKLRVAGSNPVSRSIRTRPETDSLAYVAQR